MKSIHIPWPIEARGSNQYFLFGVVVDELVDELVDDGVEELVEEGVEELVEEGVEELVDEGVELVEVELESRESRGFSD